MLLPLLVLGGFLATAEVTDNAKENKLIEASKAAAAAGQHDLSKELLCRSKSAKDTKDCKVK